MNGWVQCVKSLRYHRMKDVKTFKILRRSGLHPLYECYTYDSVLITIKENPEQIIENTL